MALKGTLKDFGIADILQLIGQQQKTGTLHLSSKDQQVTVVFKEGNIVRAVDVPRDKRDLIGTLLVQAELVSERQLVFALDTQKRTLQRLGDILVAQGALSVARFRQAMQLQTTETLYRLFSWNSGSYEFEAGEVEPDPEMVPLRAESVLMEGFRMVDEWPVVRKKITSSAMTFEKRRELPPPAARPAKARDEVDDAFSEAPSEPSGGEFQNIGEYERKVYDLVTPNRTVRKLVALSMLGEFETNKALCNLVNLDYLRAVPPSRKDAQESDGGPGLVRRAAAFAGRALVTAVLVGAAAFAATRVDVRTLQIGTSSARTFTDPAIGRFASLHQTRRIEAALEQYRLRKGEVPETIEQLVSDGLLEESDLRYPWTETYYYRRISQTEYLLLPPFR